MLVPGRRMEPRDGRRLPARGRNSPDRTLPSRKQDRAFCVPGTTSSASGGREYFGRSSADLDAQELAGGKETDRPTVGRPEWEPGALGSWNRLGLGLVQRP